MRLIIATIGKLKSGPEQALVERYVKRAASGLKNTGFGKFEILELPESRKPQTIQRQEDEGQRLLDKLPSSFQLVVFDERGKSLSSEGFADYLGSSAEGGASDLVMVIGGPDGVSTNLREKADLVVSFGKLTMPHQIVRALVAEQIYRATTILSGHPYHRQ